MEHLKHFFALTAERGIWMVSTVRFMSSVPMVRQMRNKDGEKPQYWTCLRQGRTIGISYSDIFLYLSKHRELDGKRVEINLPEETPADNLGERISNWLGLFLNFQTAIGALTILKKWVGR